MNDVSQKSRRSSFDDSNPPRQRPSVGTTGSEPTREEQLKIWRRQRDIVRKHSRQRASTSTIASCTSTVSSTFRYLTPHNNNNTTTATTTSRSNGRRRFSFSTATSRTSTIGRRSVLSPHNANEQPQTNENATQQAPMRCAACQKIRQNRNDETKQTTDGSRVKKCLACRSRQSRSTGRSSSNDSSIGLNKSNSDTSKHQIPPSTVLGNENNRNVNSDPENELIIRPSISAGDDHPSFQKDVDKPVHKNIQSSALFNTRRRSLPVGSTSHSPTLDHRQDVIHRKSMDAVNPTQKLRFSNPIDRLSARVVAQRHHQQQEEEGQQQQHHHQKHDSEILPTFISITKKPASKNLPEFLSPITLHSPSSNSSVNESLLDRMMNLNSQYCDTVESKDILNDTTELADAEVCAILNGTPAATRYGNNDGNEETYDTAYSTESQGQGDKKVFNHDGTVNHSSCDCTDVEIQAILFEKVNSEQHKNKETDVAVSTVEFIVQDHQFQTLQPAEDIENMKMDVSSCFDQEVLQVREPSSCIGPRTEAALSSQAKKRGLWTSLDRENDDTLDKVFLVAVDSTSIPSKHISLPQNIDSEHGDIVGRKFFGAGQEKASWTEKSAKTLSEQYNDEYYPLENEDGNSDAMSSICEHSDNPDVTAVEAGKITQQSETTPLLLWSHSGTESDFGISPRECRPLLFMAEVATISEHKESFFSVHSGRKKQHMSSGSSNEEFLSPQIECEKFESFLPATSSSEGDGIEIVMLSRESDNEHCLPDEFCYPEVSKDGETFSTTGATFLTNTSLFPSKSTSFEPVSDDLGSPKTSVSCGNEVRLKEILNIHVDDNNNSTTIEMTLRNKEFSIENQFIKSELSPCENQHKHSDSMEEDKKQFVEKSVHDDPFYPFKCCKGASSDDFPLSLAWSRTWSRKGTHEDEEYSFVDSFDYINFEKPVRSGPRLTKETFHDKDQHQQSFASRISSDDQLFSSSGSTRISHEEGEEEEGFLEGVVRFAHRNHQLCSRTNTATLQDRFGVFDVERDFDNNRNKLRLPTDDQVEVNFITSVDSVNITDRGSCSTRPKYSTNSPNLLQSDEPMHGDREKWVHGSSTRVEANKGASPSNSAQSNTLLDDLGSDREDDFTGDRGVEVELQGETLYVSSQEPFCDNGIATACIVGIDNANLIQNHDKCTRAEQTLSSNGAKSADLHETNPRIQSEIYDEDDETGILSDEFSFYDNDPKTNQLNSSLEDECPMLEAALEEFQSAHERLDWREESACIVNSTISEPLHDHIEVDKSDQRGSPLLGEYKFATRDQSWTKTESLDCKQVYQYASTETTSVPMETIETGVQETSHQSEEREQKNAMKPPAAQILSPEEFDWRKEIQSPAPQKGMIVKDEFDWRTELQSPAGQRRYRRRVRFSTGSKPQSEKNTMHTEVNYSSAEHCTENDFHNGTVLPEDNPSTQTRLSGILNHNTHKENDSSKRSVISNSEEQLFNERSEISDTTPSSHFSSNSTDCQGKYSPCGEGQLEEFQRPEEQETQRDKKRVTHHAISTELDDAEMKSFSSGGTMHTLSNDRELKITVPGVIKVDGQSILMTVKEELPEDPDGLIVSMSEYARLVVENKKLRDRLFALRLDYEERATPFRDLFIEQRKLREQIRLLLQERRQIDENLDSIQQRTRTAIAMSVHKSKILQSKLAEATKQNEIIPILQSELDEARRQLAKLSRAPKK